MIPSRRFPVLSRIQVTMICLALATVHPIARLCAQAPAPEPDVLIFVDGERLVGHLVRSTGGSLTFKSDMVGEITVDWSKVRELHSTQRFAVVEKGIRLHKREEASRIPQGAITMTEQKIDVSATTQGAPQTIPVANSAYVVDEGSFQRAVGGNPSLLKAWKGAVTAGASLVQATQNSRTFTTGISLVRAVPAENWLEPRNRTLVDFSASYGRVDQPNTPELKTAIYHADAERDQYFSPRLYGFGQAAFDHNFSQGLDLQQLYGGGLGWTVIKRANQTLDVKASAGYVKQDFQSAPGKSLFGSTFGERYNRQLPRGMLFTEQLSVTPPETTPAPTRPMAALRSPCRCTSA